jgi:hypothetical protein
VSEFKIDKGVPMSVGTGRRSSYPFSTMEVGDSFFVSKTKSVETIRSAASWHGTRNNKKFSVRKHDDGHRVWRVA